MAFSKSISTRASTGWALGLWTTGKGTLAFQRW